MSAAGPQPSPRKAFAAWERARFRVGPLGSIKRPGLVWAGSWTLKRIAAVIEREFGVHYHPGYLERPLKAHGFSVQRPATRARERDELVIAVWPKRDWVAQKKGAAGAPHASALG